MDKIDFSGRRVTTKDIPKLAYHLGLLTPNMPTQAMPLSALRPPGLKTDHPLRIACESVIEYLLSYVQEVAKVNMGEARLISELIEVPYLKRQKGRPWEVRRVTLANAVRERAAKLGKEVRKGLRELVSEVKG